MKTIKITLLIALSMVLSMVHLFAQESKEPLSIHIDQIISSDYPRMRAYAVVKDTNGELKTGISPSLFNFRIDLSEVEANAKIVPFSMDEEAIDYTIVFSNNGIMDGEPLDFQKNAIVQFIDILKPEDTLSLYTIGEESATIFEEQKKEDIDVAVVNEVTVTSEQPRLYDSVINVIRKIQRRNTERKVLIIISDGRDQNSRFTREQLDTVLLEAGIPIYAMGIRVLSTQSLSNLNEIADSTGGSYLYASRVSAIPDTLKQLNDYIIHPYVIDMRIKGVPADDLPHVLEISVDERDSYGEGEKTFIAVKVPVPLWLRITILVVSIIVCIGLVILAIIMRIQKRHRMGITKRKCPDCKTRMKDTWDSCPFCKYLPPKQKKIKNKEEKKKEV